MDAPRITSHDATCAAYAAPGLSVTGRGGAGPLFNELKAGLIKHGLQEPIAAL